MTADERSVGINIEETTSIILVQPGPPFTNMA